MRESDVLGFRCVPGMLELCRFLMVEVIFLVTLTFHMTERKGAAPDPLQQGCLVTLMAYLPGLSWNVWNVELCLVSSTGTGWGWFTDSLHAGLCCGIQECWGWCCVIQHWCLALPCIKWGLTRAAPLWISSHSTGELHCCRWRQYLLRRKGWISWLRAFKEAPFQEPHPILCLTQQMCLEGDLLSCSSRSYAMTVKALL